jgi:hypothetical protein
LGPLSYIKADRKWKIGTTDSLLNIFYGIFFLDTCKKYRNAVRIVVEPHQFHVVLALGKTDSAEAPVVLPYMSNFKKISEISWLFCKLLQKCHVKMLKISFRYGATLCWVRKMIDSPTLYLSILIKRIEKIFCNVVTQMIHTI